MRRFFILLMLALLAVGLVACGGSDDSDKTPGNDGDSDRVPMTKAGTATKGDTKSDTKGDTKSNGEGKFGSVTFKFSGNVEASGELAFQPVLSLFSNNTWQQLYFGGSDGQTAFILSLNPASATFMFGNGKISVAGVATGDDPPCKFNVEKQDGSGAKGTFECDNASGTGESGAVYGDGIKVKGAFDVRTK